MKVWPIDPLVPRNLRLEVPEKLPQGLRQVRLSPNGWPVPTPSRFLRPAMHLVSGMLGQAIRRRPEIPGDLGAPTLGKMQAVSRTRSEVRAIPAREGPIKSYEWYRQELACGSQAFIATLLFDPSMSALPIIPKQNSVSVGLFTH
jgi:hypothetical protein